MQDIRTDHILAPIRRLRVELSNLFTTRERVHTHHKCKNVLCPDNKIADKFVFQQRKFENNSQQSKKAALARSRSSSVVENIQTNNQSYHKKDSISFNLQVRITYLCLLLLRHPHTKTIYSVINIEWYKVNEYYSLKKFTTFRLVRCKILLRW